MLVPIGKDRNMFSAQVLWIKTRLKSSFKETKLIKNNKKIYLNKMIAISIPFLNWRPPQSSF